MLFMFTTTFTASAELIMSYWEKVDSEMTFGLVVLHTALVSAMALLAVVALLDMIRRWYKLVIKKEGLMPNANITYPNVAGQTCEANEIHL